MSILISHIYEDSYSNKIGRNKFFYGYTFILGSFILLQGYMLFYFNNNAFHNINYDLLPRNHTIFEPINNVTLFSKTLFLRNIKHKYYSINSNYNSNGLFEIIKKDIHSSLLINVFTFVAVIYIYINYNSIFFKFILKDQVFISRQNLIKYITFISYIVNISYGMLLNDTLRINKLTIDDNIDFTKKCIYNYYYLKWLSSILFISITSGSMITVLIYHYVLKNIKKMIEKTN